MELFGVHHLRLTLQLFLIGLYCGMAGFTSAAVSVLSNRTGESITVRILASGEPERSLTIPSWATRPVFFPQQASVQFGHQFARQSFDLVPGSAYLFASNPESQDLRMEKIGLGSSDSQPERPPWLPVTGKKGGTYTLKVKIAVDEDEPTHRTIWEPQLRQRVADASRILEEHCGVKLEIVSVVTWDSDDTVNDFSRSMREFEREVSVGPALLVIGFSSQYEFRAGRIHLGGSRGPLYPYIMLKERTPNIREPEKLELLVHELCHFLGASHSPEPMSVMRPVLTESRLRKLDQRVYLDPVNALLMSLLSDELQSGQVRAFADVSFSTKQRMMEIYQVLQQALPDDPAAGQYQALLGVSNSSQVTMEVREIINGLTQLAKLETARAAKAGTKHAGDNLTATYVREAAAIAEEMHSPDAAKALLLALGIFFDDGMTLRNFPATSATVTQAESEDQRRQRVSVIGQPSLRGRSDFVKHFFVSAHLTAAMGGGAARSAGLVKEVLDANGGSGFSFADMLANRAGIIFAEKLLSGEITLEEVSDSFTGDKYMPEVEGFAEGLQAPQLGRSDRGGLADELQRGEERILALPAYQSNRRKVAP
jgi:hypothetical protein